MAIYKRGRLYWYKFTWSGEPIRESTKQTNGNIARQMEAAHRSRLAKERDERGDMKKRLQCEAVARCPGCEKLFNSSHPVIEAGKGYCSDRCALEAKRKSTIIPTLYHFAVERIEPWAKATFAETTPKSWDWYRTAIRTIGRYPEIGTLALNKVSNEPLSRWASRYMAEDYSVCSANSALRVIRRMLRLAVEWGVIDAAPAVKLLSGENHREHVIRSDEELHYLAAADPELQAFSILLFDTGMRPDEAYRLRWENVNWKSGANGALFISQGKTKAARRSLFMSPRLRFTLEHRWEMAGSPGEGWVWPAATRAGHVDVCTFKKRHRKAIARANADGVKVRPFVPYSIRHTFLTRLGESGCDAWTLAKIAGHSNIGIGSRYVHPSEDAIAKAMSKLSGHNSRHSADVSISTPNNHSPLNNATPMV